MRALLIQTLGVAKCFENALMVQFDHRMVAYALLADRGFARIRYRAHVAKRCRDQSALTLVVAITIQACVGISALLTQVPVSLALLHQAIALAVLGIVVVHTATIILPSAPVRICDNIRHIFDADREPATSAPRQPISSARR